MIRVIAGRELRALLIAPLGWTVLAVVIGLLGYSLLAQVESYLLAQGRLAGLPGAPGVTELVIVPFFGTAAFILLLVAPLVTMGAVSEERRNRTLSWLLSAPISTSQLVLGKFFGALGFLVLLLVLVACMPLALLMGGTLDAGLYAGSLLGLLLLMMAFTSIGLYMSTLAVQPMVAATSSYGVLLLLWVVDWQNAPGEASVESVLSYLSLLGHVRPLFRGLVDSRDLSYCILLTVLFLALSVWRMRWLRTQ